MLGFYKVSFGHGIAFLLKGERCGRLFAFFLGVDTHTFEQKELLVMKLKEVLSRSLFFYGHGSVSCGY